jgi:hypothetical protein
VVEKDVGGRPEGCLARKNKKIPEVAKVNNDPKNVLDRTAC